MKQIYLDYAATAPVLPTAAQAAINSIENFGNPSSLHQMGMAAEKAINQARSAIAAVIGAKPAEVYFTSGGTEANNLAIFGAAKAHNGNRIITTAAEHPSALEPIKQLARRGFDVVYLKLSQGGLIDPAALRQALAHPACLVTIHHVNNETGVQQDIPALAKIIKEAGTKTLLHVDGVQSFCKIPIDVKTMGIDMLSLSAHKIGGLKGCGALFVQEKVHLKPIIFGGEQENGLRAGTENVPGITAFAAATPVDVQANLEYVTALKDRFLTHLQDQNIQINGQNTIPHIANISIPDIRPEVLLNALSAQGVYVSAGSACSSNKRGKSSQSPALQAYGLPPQRASHALRISFSTQTTVEEVDTAAKIFASCINNLRKTPKLR